MSEILRPCTLGEILDQTAQLYRRNFWLFAGVGALPVCAMIAALMAGVLIAIPASVASKGAMPANTVTGLAVFVVLLVMMPVYLAASVFSSAGLTQAAVSTHRGEKLTVRGALKSVRPWFWRYLGLMLLQVILVALAPGAIACAVAVPLVYLASQAGAGVAAGAAIGFVVFLAVAAAIGVMVWLALSYAMGFAVCVVEKKPAWESLKRAWKLSQGTRGRIFVLFLLLMALSLAATMIGYMVLGIAVAVGMATGNGPQGATAALVVGEILDFVVNLTMQVLLAPVSWIALVLFYYDQRIRTEGYDIEWMMEQAGLSQFASPPAESAESSWPAAPPDTVEER